jgi:pimeloyl-ACP methyl ester carboxylesterase
MDAPPAPRTTEDVGGLAVTRRRPAEASCTVVLVHGAMDRAASFGRVMRRLGDLDVVAYDRRGYAGSLEVGPAEGLVAHAEDLAEVCRWARPERLVVVGHSVGGLVALCAARHGLDGLPLVAVGAYEAPMPWLEQDDVGTGEPTLAVARDRGPAAAAEFFYRAMVGDRVWDRLREPDRAARRAEGPALVSELTAVRHPATPVSFDGIRATVHVARGERSAPHLRDAAARLAAATGAVCEEVPAAGHGAHLSHPDEFARWVRAMT